MISFGDPCFHCGYNISFLDCVTSNKVTYQSYPCMTGQVGAKLSKGWGQERPGETRPLSRSRRLVPALLSTADAAPIHPQTLRPGVTDQYVMFGGMTLEAWLTVTDMPVQDSDCDCQLRLRSDHSISDNCNHALAEQSRGPGSGESKAVNLCLKSSWNICQ